MRTYFFTAMTFLVCASALANEMPYAGVWIGAIGNSEVQVCFSSRESQYYYLKHKQGILLILDENADAFSEWQEIPNVRDNDVSGKWKIAEFTKDVLRGSWTSPDGKKKHGIKLTKVAELTEPYDTCGKEYYRPIENSVIFNFPPDQSKDANFRIIQTDSAEAFELLKPLAGASESNTFERKFNAFVRTWLKQQAVDSYECQLTGGSGWWHTELRLLDWTKNYLVVEDILPLTYCGGDEWYTGYLTFDFQTGLQVDTWSWIKRGKKAVEWTRGDKKLPQLRALLVKISPREECNDLNDFSINAPYPSKEGMVFPFHELRCETDATVDYQTMRPYLTPAGLAAVSEFLRNK